MKADLVLLKQDGTQKAFPMTGDVIVIGRQHDCDLRVPLPTISRRHCQIGRNGQSLKIRDLGSKAGTFINDKRIDADGDALLKAGDLIRIGPIVFACRIDGKPEKIAPPARKDAPSKPKAAKPKPQSKPKKEPSADIFEEDLDKTSAGKPGGGLDDSFADLDASDSFIGLDEGGNAEDKKGKKKQ